jgi:hypothetical protein
MKPVSIFAALALAVALPAAAADYQPAKVVPAAGFADLRAVVGALGHEIEAEDAKNRTLRAADSNGTRYLLTGTACDVDGVPGCRGVVMQVLFEGKGAVTLDRLAAANLKQVAVSTRFDPDSNVVSVTRYVVLDGGVTMANLAENVAVLLALVPEIAGIVFDTAEDANRPG